MELRTQGVAHSTSATATDSSKNYASARGTRGPEHTAQQIQSWNAADTHTGLWVRPASTSSSCVCGLWVRPASTFMAGLWVRPASAASSSIASLWDHPGLWVRPASAALSNIAGHWSHPIQCRSANEGSWQRCCFRHSTSTADAPLISTVCFCSCWTSSASCPLDIGGRRSYTVAGGMSSTKTTR